VSKLVMTLNLAERSFKVSKQVSAWPHEYVGQ